MLHSLETELIAMLKSSLLNMTQKCKITTTKPQADLQYSVFHWILYKVNLKAICYLLPQLSSIGVNLEQAGIRHEVQSGGMTEKRNRFIHFWTHLFWINIWFIPDSRQSELPFLFTEASLYQKGGVGRFLSTGKATIQSSSSEIFPITALSQGM